MVDQPYAYRAVANDPDGINVTYVLVEGPEGMSFDSATGQIDWTPIQGTPDEIEVILRAYDSRGGFASQSFNIEVEGGNRAPVIEPIGNQVVGAENAPFELRLGAIDPDGDPVVMWVENLPDGARFDASVNSIRWTPGFTDAGAA